MQTCGQQMGLFVIELLFVIEYCAIRRAGSPCFDTQHLTLHMLLDDKISFQILTAFSVFDAVSHRDYFLAFFLQRLIFPLSIGSSNRRRKELLLGCFTLSKRAPLPSETSVTAHSNVTESHPKRLDPLVNGDVC